MKLLLDTHAFLWWTLGSASLKRAAATAIANPGNAVFISVASIWEIGLKKSLRLIQLPDDIEPELAKRGLTPLAVEIAHAERALRLPDIHRDPFDRMLIAQAQVEGLTLVTHDKLIFKYDVAVLKT
ncbi:MAG: type II toxin-antitoxin system VapC family toxin [Rhodospirillaceae bacterium]|nr:type II toxin-antitoxin system VapC family toxin [Rhodospirillaceae bacterium]